MRLTICALGFALLAVACGPNASNGDDDSGNPDGGNSCTGSETRCDGSLYETCSNGSYQTTQACASACNVDLGGCVACDPTAGNTCSGNDVVMCNADGTYGSTVMSCGDGATCAGGQCNRTCTADGVDLIYLVDVDNHFLSFDPRLLGTPSGPYHLIGTLTCPGGSALEDGSTATPFSMSVDRTGKAWVLYNSGKIFNVDLTTAACTDSGFTVQQQNGAWSLFGMGYSSDSAGADTEKLYIAGGPVEPAAQQMFGYIDGSNTVQNVGNINAGENSPELTGTGDAKLYGYFPGTISNGFVQEIDKTSGHVTGNAMQAGTVAGGPLAWAFAQWGGKFYIFITDTDNEDNQVQQVDRATGHYDGITLDNTNYEVVGAGVSTCAPVNIP